MIYCSSWRASRPSTILLVQGLGEGGGGSDVSVTGSLVGTSGLLEGLSILKVSSAVLLVGSGVVGVDVDVEGETRKESKHVDETCAVQRSLK